MKTLLVALLLLAASPVAAQEEEGEDTATVGGVLQSLLGIRQPRIGLLMQFDGRAEYQYQEWYSYYEVHNLRLLLMGSVADRFDYFFQGSLNGDYSLLDLKLTYRFSDQLWADAGQFKTPFGWEYLQQDGQLLFVNRSRVAQTIGTLRDKGIQLSGSFFAKRITVVAGAFGGSGFSSDNSISLFVARASVFPLGVKREPDELKIELGGSAAYSGDYRDLSWVDNYAWWADYKVLYSANARLEYQKTWIGGEYSVVGEKSVKYSEGARVDLATALITNLEIALRFDWMERYAWPSYDSPSQRIYSSREYFLGTNWYPAKGIKIQGNLGRDFDYNTNTAILNLQYGVNLPK